MCHPGPHAPGGDRRRRGGVALKRTPYQIRDDDYFLYPDRYRQAVARLIGGRPEEIAVTDSATAGIMMLVNGLDWAAGDEVVIPAGTFPSNRFPWLWLARRGVKVVTVPEILDGSAGGDGADLERYAAALSPRTRLLSLHWVSFSNGLRYDLAGLGELCRRRGILFAVDATQGWAASISTSAVPRATSSPLPATSGCSVPTV